MPQSYETLSVMKLPTVDCRLVDTHLDRNSIEDEKNVTRKRFTVINWIQTQLISESSARLDKIRWQVMFTNGKWCLHSAQCSKPAYLYLQTDNQPLNGFLRSDFLEEANVWWKWRLGLSPLQTDLNLSQPDKAEARFPFPKITPERTFMEANYEAAPPSRRFHPNSIQLGSNRLLSPSWIKQISLWGQTASLLL